MLGKFTVEEIHSEEIHCEEIHIAEIPSMIFTTPKHKQQPIPYIPTRAAVAVAITNQPALCLHPVFSQTVDTIESDEKRI